MPINNNPMLGGESSPQVNHIAMKECLSSLPESWKVVPVSGKRPIYGEWQHATTTAKDLVLPKKATGIGLLLGDGLLALDFDGSTAIEALASVNLAVSDLPPTVGWTSDREGRQQLLFTVDPQWWDKLRTVAIPTSGTDPDGKQHQLELRWKGAQSVLPPSLHPDTGKAYRWIADPGSAPVGGLSDAILEKLIRLIPNRATEKQKVVPIRRAEIADQHSLARFLSRDLEEILSTGVKEGRRNEFAFKLACGLIATERELTERGIAFNGSAAELYQGFCDLVAMPAKEADSTWRSAEKKNPDAAWIEDRISFLSKPRRNPDSLEMITAGEILSMPVEDDAVEAEVTSQEPIIPILSPPPTPIEVEAEKRLTPGKLTTMLERAYGKSLRLNLLKGSVSLDGESLPKPDHFYVTASLWGYKIGKDAAIDTVMSYAARNSYHPVKDYLDSLEESSDFPIKRFASTFFRPEDLSLPEPTIYDRMVEVFLIGTVKRVYEPGCQHDTVLILQGKQGARKTSTFEALAGPEWFNGSFTDIGNKDHLLGLHQHWISEWGELENITGRKESSAIKHFITVRKDSIRIPYGRGNQEMPRQFVLCGSTNQEGFLPDSTGNRRFHVIPVTAESIDVEAIEGSRDAIWSAAKALYRSGARNYLEAQETDLVERLNRDHLEVGEWLKPIRDWLNTHNSEGEIALRSGKGLDSITVLTKAIGFEPKQITKRESNQMARELRALGLERRRVRIGGVPEWRWFDPSLDPPTTQSTPAQVASYLVRFHAPSRPLSSEALAQHASTLLGETWIQRNLYSLVDHMETLAAEAEIPFKREPHHCPDIPEEPPF